MQWGEAATEGLGAQRGSYRKVRPGAWELGHAETQKPAGEGLAQESSEQAFPEPHRRGGANGLPQFQHRLTARPAWMLEQTRVTLQISYSHPGSQPKRPRGMLALGGVFSAEKSMETPK